jgi:hypothetical protein
MSTTTTTTTTITITEGIFHFCHVIIASLIVAAVRYAPQKE